MKVSKTFENQNDVWYTLKLVIWAHTKGMCFWLYGKAGAVQE